MPRPVNRPISRDDLLSVADAVREMGIADKDAREWLRTEGLLVDLAGRDRVIWGEVLDRLRTKRDGAARMVKAVAPPPMTDAF